MKIVVGTENKAKLKAIKDVIHKCVYFENPKNIEIIGKSVESGVSVMPISLDEIITGSKNRANNLIISGIDANFYIGIEGGTTRIGDKSYLFGVVYISDGKNGHLGLSSLVEVPNYIDDKIYNHGMDLGKIQDDLMEEHEKDNNHKNGSFGEWTGDMITRSESFEQAFICAISPFYNKYYKL